LTTKTYWADLLLNHMRTCRACKAAKIADTPHYCQRGQWLIKNTLKERHGDK
jgi:hypothetical protein